MQKQSETPETLTPPPMMLTELFSVALAAMWESPVLIGVSFLVTAANLAALVTAIAPFASMTQEDILHLPAAELASACTRILETLLLMFFMWLIAANMILFSLHHRFRRTDMSAVAALHNSLERFFPATLYWIVAIVAYGIGWASGLAAIGFGLLALRAHGIINVAGYSGLNVAAAIVIESLLFLAAVINVTALCTGHVTVVLKNANPFAAPFTALVTILRGAGLRRVLLFGSFQLAVFFGVTLVTSGVEYVLHSSLAIFALGLFQVILVAGANVFATASILLFTENAQAAPTDP